MSTPRRIPPAASALIGIVAAGVCLLPWVAAGMRLPLQNLWAAATLPDDMPFALLPFSQYALPSLLGLLALPGALTGLVLRRRTAALGRWLATAGIAAVQAIAIVQTSVVTAEGMRTDAGPLTYASDVGSFSTAAALYLGALVVFTVVAALIGAVALHLVAAGGVRAATIGLTVGAVVTGSWIRAWLDVSGPFSVPPPPAIGWAAAAAPPILTGAALAWCGWHPPRRLTAWAGALAVLWLAPVAMTALVGAVSSRVNLGSWGRMLDAGLGTLQWTLVGGLAPVAIAVVLGAAGAAARSRRATRRVGAGETLEGGVASSDRRETT